MSSNSNKVYHNTTSLTGEILLQATEKALKLKDIILQIFKEQPEDKTPFEVSVMLIKRGHKYPITSIRARMNALTKENRLLKSLNADAVGDYNAPNHTWKLNTFLHNTISEGQSINI